ncbi:MAG TPA: sulfatase-like hydrolase/transferase [Verrucomicrobiae bacterium]|nr:sulfatase-like hydrolase/transferase [Verrucomicrobiae bacterium]
MGNILHLDQFALGPAAIFNPSRFGRHVRRDFVDGVTTPWFLFVNFGETHHRFVYEGCSWYDEPFDYGDANECKRKQRACLEYLDGQIQRLVQALPESDLIICSDHGEAFGEDGLWGHGFHHPVIMEVPMHIQLRQ